MTSNINRTYHPKYLTYTGDGSGRDGYVVFGNGGLHDLRDYKGGQGKPHYDGNKGRVPKPYVASKKEPTAFDYVPDGTGRDTYIIYNYGLKANYRSNFREFEHGLRADQTTPMMDQKMGRRKDPFGIDIASYNNWYSPKVRQHQNQVFSDQRCSVERLSKSPKHSMNHLPATPDHRAESLKNSVQKTKMSYHQDLKLPEHHQPGLLADTFFRQHAMRQTPPEIMVNTPVKLRQKNLEMTRGYLTNHQRLNNLQARKLSVQEPAATIKGNQKGNFFASFNNTPISQPKNNNVTLNLQKTLGQQNKAPRAQSTLQYMQPLPLAAAVRGPTTAEPTLRSGNRIKKVGNLTSIEQQYKGARFNQLNKTIVPENIVPRVLFTSQGPPQKMETLPQDNDLDKIRQHNQQLRDRLNQTLQLDSIRKNNSAMVQKNFASTMKKNPELDIKKMTTELTKGSTMFEASANGSPFKDFQTPGGGEYESFIGSPVKEISSPTKFNGSPTKFNGSPTKVDGRGSNLAMRQLRDQRRGSAGVTNPANQRSHSVQRNGQSAVMAKTTPGFCKPTTATMPQND